MPTTVSAEFASRAEELVTHYPESKRSASLPLLHLWQEEFGYISEEGIEWIAEKLDLEPINILELVTFYPMFRQQPLGTYHIKVCRTLSCALGGADKTHQCFKKKIGLEGDDHTALTSGDQRYTLEYVECIASCGTAPVVMINDDFHENVDEVKAQELLNRYK